MGRIFSFLIDLVYGVLVLFFKFCQWLFLGNKKVNYGEMDGFEFEQHCANVLAHKGYKKVEVTKGSGDQGIDVIAYKGGEKYGIQCKYYLNPVGNKAVQEAYTGISVHQCDVAMVMTNNTFTKGAREAAESTGVILWDYVPRQVEPYFFGLFKRVLLCLFLLLVGFIIYYIF